MEINEVTRRTSLNSLEVIKYVANPGMKVPFHAADPAAAGTPKDPGDWRAAGEDTAATCSRRARGGEKPPLSPVKQQRLGGDFGPEIPQRACCAPAAFRNRRPSCLGLEDGRAAETRISLCEQRSGINGGPCGSCPVVGTRTEVAARADKPTAAFVGVMRRETDGD